MYIVWSLGKVLGGKERCIIFKTKVIKSFLVAETYLKLQSNLRINVTQGKTEWSLQTSGYYLEFFLFYFIKEALLKYCLYLQGGLYPEVVFNTGLTVHIIVSKGI